MNYMAQPVLLCDYPDVSIVARWSYSIESRNILIASSSGTRAGNLCASSKKKTGIFFDGGDFSASIDDG